MMHLYNFLLPVCILITGIMNIVVGIKGLKEERKEEKRTEIKALEEQKKETEQKECLEIKKRWEEVMG